MNKLQKEVREQIRLACGLLSIIDSDMENLKDCTNANEIDKLLDQAQETSETIDRLSEVMAQLEYILYLDRFKGFKGL